ncbi:16S rRNA (uracil(1498)-N(3))-methyltransferase [Halobacillus sp. BBL2006]|uniref:16S rRNA (uracil(1498)-N(3))-methyltransferase n=1 Tax=Halobacillus sp. BBL2006 TaxID=1543706 RepID=UPI000541FCC2|nr:16S rRNA (uracil(1498)-N(3))-methyltransferase [Halobacillus sp. BBL2006]KHE70117.1 16S rRNA methyltransferase [Halobacillus sp. BBL2006]
MQRYFVESKNWKENQVVVIGEDVHHISRVMRMQDGDHLVAVHPERGAAKCVITNVAIDKIECDILEWLEEYSELPARVTIVQSLGKGDKMDQVVQKGTELGAFTFVPYQAERSVAKWDDKKAEKKTHRLSKIAKEASEQSERVHVPEVLSLHTLDDLIDLAAKHDLCLFAYEDEARQNRRNPLSSILSEVKSGDGIMIVFGPEGGFTDHEVTQLRENNFSSVRLGPRILRMETAPLYFLSSLSYQLEET